MTSGGTFPHSPSEQLHDASVEKVRFRNAARHVRRSVDARSVGGVGATHVGAGGTKGRVVLRGVAYTPAPEGAERRAIMNAVRKRVRTKAVFEVSHLLAADGWAFIRCGEVVTVEGERQETDLYVVALLKA